MAANGEVKQEQQKTPEQLNQETYNKIKTEITELTDDKKDSKDKIEGLDGKLTSGFFEHLKEPKNNKGVKELYDAAKSITMEDTNADKAILKTIITFLEPIANPINLGEADVSNAAKGTADKFYNNVEENKTDITGKLTNLIDKINNNPDLAKLKTNLEKINKILIVEKPNKEDVVSLQAFLNDSLVNKYSKDEKFTNFLSNSKPNGNRDGKFGNGTMGALNLFITEATSKIDGYEKAKTIADENDKKVASESLGEKPEDKKATIDKTLNSVISNGDDVVKKLTFSSTLVDNKVNIQFNFNNQNVGDSISLDLDNPKLDAELPIKIDGTNIMYYKLFINGKDMKITDNPDKNDANVKSFEAMTEVETKNNETINKLLKDGAASGIEKQTNGNRGYKYGFDEKQTEAKSVDGIYTKTIKIEDKDYKIGFEINGNKPELTNNRVNIGTTGLSAILKIDNNKLSVMIDQTAKITQNPEYKKLTTNEASNKDGSKTIVYPKGDKNLGDIKINDDGKISYTGLDSQFGDIKDSKDLWDNNKLNKGILDNEEIMKGLVDNSMNNRIFTENKDVFDAMKKGSTDIRGQMESYVKESLANQTEYSKQPLIKIGEKFYYYKTSEVGNNSFDKGAATKNTLELINASKDIEQLSAKIKEQTDKSIGDLREEIKPIKETYDKISLYMTDRTSGIKPKSLSDYKNNLEIKLNLEDNQNLFNDSKIKDRKVDFVFNNIEGQNITFGKKGRFEKAESLSNGNLAKFDDVNNKLIFA